MQEFTEIFLMEHLNNYETYSSFNKNACEREFEFCCTLGERFLEEELLQKEALEKPAETNSDNEAQ